jgi:hypothetical protein
MSSKLKGFFVRCGFKKAVFHFSLNNVIASKMAFVKNNLKSKAFLLFVVFTKKKGKKNVCGKCFFICYTPSYDFALSKFESHCMSFFKRGFVNKMCPLQIAVGQQLNKRLFSFFFFTAKHANSYFLLFFQKRQKKNVLNAKCEETKKFKTS